MDYKKLNLDENFYLISDTHFYHKNIIEYCKRPFSSVKEMNERIIENWNKTIRPNDIVFFLGDFSFGSKRMIEEIFNKLNGNIILIKGNHDRKNKLPFLDEQKLLITYKNKYNFLLQHRPPQEITEDKNIYIIHGHTHSEKIITAQNTINVSCEAINYTPINIEEIIERNLRRFENSDEDCQHKECDYYNIKFDLNCDANEDLCEKCNGKLKINKKKMVFLELVEGENYGIL